MLHPVLKKGWLKIPTPTPLHCCVFWPVKACLCMGVNGQKQWKTFKNHEKSTSFLFVRLTWASRAQNKKDTFFMIIEWFSLFSIMWKHAQACSCWSKYTTMKGWIDGWEPKLVNGTATQSRKKEMSDWMWERRRRKEKRKDKSLKKI